MTATERVLEARRRLRESATTGGTDHALRIVELHSPRADGVGLRLRPGLNIISGMTPAATLATEQTIEALRRNDPEHGLDGVALVDGRRAALHAERLLPPRRLARGALFGSVPKELHLTPAEVHSLKELLSSLDSAISLASAELRGADATLRDMRMSELDVPEIIDLRPDDVERAGIRDAIAEVEAMSPDAALIERLRSALETRTSDRKAQRLEAVAAQYVAAIDGLQPSDPESVRQSLERSLQETRAELDELSHDTTSLGEIASVLKELQITCEPDEALNTATRAVGEADELEAISRRLRSKLGRPLAKGRGDNTPSPRLLSIEERKTKVQRRLHSLRKLRSAAHEQLAAQSVNTNFMLEMPIGSSTGHSPDGRQLPVVVDDVAAHLPSAVVPGLELMLKRLSAATQVLVLTTDDGSDITPAPGWFGGSDE